MNACSKRSDSLRVARPNGPDPGTAEAARARGAGVAHLVAGGVRPAGEGATPPGGLRAPGPGGGAGLEGTAPAPLPSLFPPGIPWAGAAEPAVVMLTRKDPA